MGEDVRINAGRRLRTLLMSALLLALVAGAGASPSRGQEAATIAFNPAQDRIEVRGAGATVTLSNISAALADSALLERLGPREWLLKADLFLFEQVRLELHGAAAGGDVDWLKLRSDPTGFASIESSNGQISIRGTRITSWNAAAQGFDLDFLDGSGRSFISIKNRSSIYTGNRMDVIDSDISHLGFFDETAYGISWKVLYEPDSPAPAILGQGLTGVISGSKFHHNYFGVYVWGVGDMQVRNNEIYENYGYGFDAHTVTQRTIVEDNISRDNGFHGIIFAEDCTDNIVRRNTSINNEGHGIMLHERSHNNLVEDNTSIGNADGVALFESSNNTIRGNVIRDNRVGVRIYNRGGESRDNLFEANLISGSETYGVFIYDGVAANTFRDNQILSSAQAGVYLKTVFDNVFSANAIRANEDGVRIDSSTARSSSGNRFEGNAIADNRLAGISSYAREGSNVLDGNQFSGNSLGDIRYLSRGLGGISALASGLAGWARLLVLAAIIVALGAGLRVALRRRAAPDR